MNDDYYVLRRNISQELWQIVRKNLNDRQIEVVIAEHKSLEHLFDEVFLPTPSEQLEIVLSQF